MTRLQVAVRLLSSIAPMAELSDQAIVKMFNVAESILKHEATREYAEKAARDHKIKLDRDRMRAQQAAERAETKP
jgi:hypothetical protein